MYIGMGKLPLWQTIYHSCILTLVLDVKSKIHFNHAAAEVIQANGGGPLELLKALPALKGLYLH